MNKLISLFGAAVLALTVSVSTATPSFANPARDAIGAGIVGGVFGFIAGAALADASRHHRVYIDEGYDYPDYGDYGDYGDSGYRAYAGHEPYGAYRRGYSRYSDYTAVYDVQVHIRACLQAYRSYDPRSDSFVGYDGYRHPCNL
jgi:hypothetical protein